MSDREVPPGGQIDLTNVVAPADIPSDVPDDKTAAEIAHAREIGGLKPNEKHIHALERHLARTEGERNRLLTENTNLRSQLDAVRPTHAALLESHRHAGANGTNAALCNTVGSLLLGVGGYSEYFANSTRLVFFGAGVAATLIAVWVSFGVRRRLWPKEQAHENR